MTDPRFERLSGSRTKKEKDFRTDGQIDRDRLLYSTAFRRLAEITQVVHAAEGHQFHNRLTHVLKVAQIGRRIAERLLAEEKEKKSDTISRLGGLDVDVVEAAGLAHDMGHPPFGHVAEEQLAKLAFSAAQISDGFEGNAQSFRIVTKLSTRAIGEGLDLTRATLNAILKYPWLQQADGYESKKWGVYLDEKEQFENARSTAPYKNSKTLEAEIMDWADDVAYAVYDLDDFYRAGLIPLDRLIEQSDSHLENLFKSIKSRWERKKKPTDKLDKHWERLGTLLHVLRTRKPLREPYLGTRDQRAALRDVTSLLVNRYAIALSLREKEEPKASPIEGFIRGTSPVRIDDEMKQEVSMLKELTWTYVIENPSLAAQQEGQKEIIDLLFRKFNTAAERGDWNIFPTSIRKDLMESPVDWKAQKVKRTRAVIDLIATMTEIQAVEFYRRLTGHSFGSIVYGIIR